MQICAFLDFQGTLGGSGLDDICSLELYACSAPAVRLLNENGVLAIGVTNQSRIAKGALSMAAYERALACIEAELAAQGAHFDAVYCCPHERADACRCKKPRTGMIDDALRDFDIDIAKSYVVGDMGMNDMLLAKNVGAMGILVLTGVGAGSMGAFRSTWADCEAHYVAQDVLDAARYIVASK